MAGKIQTLQEIIFWLKKFIFQSHKNFFLVENIPICRLIFKYEIIPNRYILKFCLGLGLRIGFKKGMT